MNTLSLRRNPVRLALSKPTWAASWYLFCYLFTGSVLFAIALTAAITGAVLSITLAGRDRCWYRLARRPSSTSSGVPSGLAAVFTTSGVTAETSTALATRPVPWRLM